MTNQKSKSLHHIIIDGVNIRTYLNYNLNTHNIVIGTSNYIYNKNINFKRSIATCIICGDKLHGRQRKYCSEHKYKAHKQQMKDNYKNNKCKWLCENGQYHDDLLERNRNNIYKYNIRPHLTPVNHCIQLNKRFPNSEGHHIMSGVVIFIPKYIHRSVDHRFPKPNQNELNMNKINKLALEYLYGEI